ncbi:MAG: hypothetical protein EXR52_00585 [Dehalococcoidia bacterium]|nr:hypothetical protein [Dehalococcoidia bacterium]
MLRSENRIFTTHTGSLPRPADLVELIRAREAGEPLDAQAFAARVQSAVTEAVGKQVESGIDSVSDGELGKPSFATYVTYRITGFDGENLAPRTSADAEAFPEWAKTLVPNTMKRKFCVGPLAYQNKAELEADLANVRVAAQAAGAHEVFMPSASVGIIADIMENQFYPTDEAYYHAIAMAMKVEYDAIAKAGFILQIDAPDTAMCRHTRFRHRSLEDFRAWQSQCIDALNEALVDVPREQIRFHTCWGNNESPHVHDVPLKDIVDLVLRVKAGAYSIEASNPRHAHEWRLWEDVKLPEGAILMPGVIDSTTNFVEHPELVADRIEQFARLVGRENVVAGTDCGFGTAAGRMTPHPEVVWHKLHALAEGAELASKRLWGR